MRLKTLKYNCVARYALLVISAIILLLLLSCERSNNITRMDTPNESEIITATPGNTINDLESPRESQIITTTPESTSSGLESPNKKPDLTNMSDEELLNVINTLETSLSNEDEFIFNNSKDIPTDTLYIFFLHSLSDAYNEGYEYYNSKWLKDDGYFHIPVDDIAEQLARYFAEFNFDPSSLIGYDPIEHAVITDSITYNGRTFDSRVVEKFRKDDMLTVKVSFFMYTKDVEDKYKYFYRELIKLKTYSFHIYKSGYHLLSVDIAPPPFSQEEAQYNGVKIDSTVDEMINILGQPDEIIDVIGVSVDTPDHKSYRYGKVLYQALLSHEDYRNDVISYINIKETDVGTAPRGICIGDSFEEVLNKFPQEYNYTTDIFERIYGVRTDSGAGGMVDSRNDTLFVTTKNVQPYMCIYFEENKVVCIVICRPWD